MSRCPKQFRTAVRLRKISFSGISEDSAVGGLRLRHTGSRKVSRRWRDCLISVDYASPRVRTKNKFYGKTTRHHTNSPPLVFVSTLGRREQSLVKSYYGTGVGSRGLFLQRISPDRRVTMVLPEAVSTISESRISVERACRRPHRPAVDFPFCSLRHTGTGAPARSSETKTS